MKSKTILRAMPFILILAVFLTITPTWLSAQDSCNALVQEALQRVGDNCGDMDRNSACYGYFRVNASFVEEQTEDFFTDPADRTEIRLLETISTATMDVANGQWGIAVLKLQANIPNTIPGQAVIFMLIGDVEVENAVEAGEVFTPADPVPIITQNPSNIRSGPGLDYNVLGSVPAGVELQTDGLSEDGEWLRVVYQDVPGWVFAPLVATEADLAALPTLTRNLRTPMQAFYLRTGIGEVECANAPQNALMVQGPENITIDLTVNGAEISLASTVLFRIIQPGNIMEITVIDGHAVIGGVTVYPGYKTTVCLSDPDNLGVDGQPNDRVVSCEPSPPVPLDPDDTSGWCVLGDVPPLFLNYPVPIGCDVGVINYQPPITTGPGGGPSGYNCSALTLGGPLDGMQAVTNTFWWQGIDAATDYRVVLYDQSGAVMGSYATLAPTTWIDIGGIPPNTAFQWAVEAYRNGEMICAAMSPAPVPVFPPAPQFTAGYRCTSNGLLKVFWNHAQPDDTITITLYLDWIGPVTLTGSGYAGEVTYNPTYIVNRAVLETSSGNRLNVPIGTNCPMAGP